MLSDNNNNNEPLLALTRCRHCISLTLTNCPDLKIVVSISLLVQSQHSGQESFDWIPLQKELGDFRALTR